MLLLLVPTPLNSSAAEGKHISVPLRDVPGLYPGCSHSSLPQASFAEDAASKRLTVCWTKAKRWEMGMGKDWKGWSHQEEPWRWTWEWKLCVESADLGVLSKSGKRGSCSPRLVWLAPNLLFFFFVYLWEADVLSSAIYTQFLAEDLAF